MVCSDSLRQSRGLQWLAPSVCMVCSDSLRQSHGLQVAVGTAWGWFFRGAPSSVAPPDATGGNFGAKCAVALDAGGPGGVGRRRVGGEVRRRAAVGASGGAPLREPDRARRGRHGRRPGELDRPVCRVRCGLRCPVYCSEIWALSRDMHGRLCVSTINDITAHNHANHSRPRFKSLVTWHAIKNILFTLKRVLKVVFEQ